MTPNPHDNARQLIALARAEDLSDAQQMWLRTHLGDCASCNEYAEAASRTIRALRSQPLAADSSLVRATQLRVRSRTLELRQQQERLWVIGICCIAVTLGTALSTAVLWSGLAWMGQLTSLPRPVWQLALLAIGFTPAIVAGILMLTRGTYLDHHHGTTGD